MRTVVLLLLFGAASAAHAQLYRWVDPATGSVKFSSVPPPWYGDPALERRAPKTERIPSGAPAPAVRGDLPPPADPSAARPLSPLLGILDEQRRMLIRDIVAVAAKGGPEAVATARRKADEVQAIMDQLDKADPAGIANRQADLQPAVKAVTELLARENAVRDAPR